jgi:hypothetical protein
MIHLRAEPGRAVGIRVTWPDAATTRAPVEPASWWRHVRRSAGGARRRLVTWRRRRALARQVELALRAEAAGLPPPRTPAERRERAQILAVTRMVVLATLTRLDPEALRLTIAGADEDDG